MPDKFTRKRYLTKTSSIDNDEKKKFSGKIYRFTTWHPTKPEATRYARMLRGLGYLIRTEAHKVKGEGTVWLLWSRRKD